VFQRREIIHILENAVETGTMAGRDPFVGSRILYIFDSIATKRTAPVRFRIRLVFLDDSLVYGQRFVKFTDAPEVISAIEGCSSLLIVHFRKRHRGTTAVARPKSFVRRKLDVPAAHLALDDRHKPLLLFC